MQDSHSCDWGSNPHSSILTFGLNPTSFFPPRPKACVWKCAPTLSDSSFPLHQEHNSINRGLANGRLTACDADLIRAFIAESQSCNNISAGRTNKIVFTLVGWRRFIGPYLENSMADIYQGISALKTAPPAPAANPSSRTPSPTTSSSSNGSMGGRSRTATPTSRTERAGASRSPQRHHDQGGRRPGRRPRGAGDLRHLERGEPGPSRPPGEPGEDAADPLGLHHERRRHPPPALAAP